jgi:Ca2+:H+ antiporter
MWCAFGVVEQAEYLAKLLGEPLGTLILTLSILLLAKQLYRPAILATLVCSGRHRAIPGPLVC